MKVSRATLAMMASTVTAFSVGSRSTFLERSSAASLWTRSPLASSYQAGFRRNTPRGTTTMLLGNLFGGGAFESKIDYSALVFPGPELATEAEQGNVMTNSPSKPHLAIASFAGGCFWGVELAYQRVPGVEYTAVGYTQGTQCLKRRTLSSS